MSTQNQQRKLFYGLPFHHWLIYRATWWLLWVINKFIFRIRHSGLENLPKDKPYLLLPNHSAMLDPFWVAHPMYRPARFMGSNQLLNIPFLGTYLKILGTFPKKKFTKDKESMQALQQYYDQGFIVTLFPEGNRCWNGRTGVILPGIGRLIKRMKANVVYAQLTSAHFVHPRWAKYPRLVPIEIKYDGPYSYPDHITAEEITKDVISRLQCTASFPANSYSVGYRMAVGLEQYLWACPSCMTMESISVTKQDQNQICCSSCQAQWTINTQTQLLGKTSLTVAEAYDKIDRHFGSPPIANPEIFEEKGISLGPLACTLWFHPRKKPPEKRTQGWLHLTAKDLVIMQDDTEVYKQQLSAIRAISVEVGNRLFFRVDGDLFRIESPTDSSIKLDHFLRKWRLHITGTEF